MPVNLQSKRNRLLKNSFYGLFSWLLPILPTMIATPIVVDGLGKERYGLLVAILGFITYFFTNGIGRVAAKYVAEYRSTGETDKISGIISSTVVLGVVVTVIGSVATLFLSRFIVTDVLLVPISLQDDAITGLYLGCATVLSIMLSQIFQFVLQGLERFDRYLLLTNLSSVCFSVGSIVLILCGYGVVALLYWNLFTSIAIGLLSYIVAKGLLPEFKFSLQIDGEAWRSVYRYAASIISYQIFGNVLLLFERGWIMRKFGPEALSYYAIPMILGMYLHLFIGSIVVAMFPMVNELLTEREKLATLYQKSTKLVLTLTSFAVLSVIVLGDMFLGLWLDDDFARVSYPLFVIHIVTFALLAVSTIVWQVAESFRAAKLNALSTLAWMAIAIPMMVALSDGWQISGVALGRLIGVLVFIPMIFYVERRFLGGIFWRFWGFISIRIAFAAFLAVVAELAVVSLIGRSWAAFSVTVLAGAILFLTGLIFTNFFDAAEKQLLRDVVAKYR